MTKKDILAAALTNALPAAFRVALSLVLDWECEYEADGTTIRWEEVPGDHGGATFAGLTRFGDHLPDDPTSHNIADIYYHDYWVPLNGLPTLVQEVVFFEGVNIGLGTAVERLQEALNDYGARLSCDGKLGDLTRRAAYQCPDSHGLGMAFLQKVRRHYEALVYDHPDQEKFLRGWLNRLDAAKGLLA